MLFLQQQQKQQALYIVYSWANAVSTYLQVLLLLATQETLRIHKFASQEGERSANSPIATLPCCLLPCYFTVLFYCIPDCLDTSLCVTFINCCVAFVPCNRTYVLCCLTAVSPQAYTRAVGPRSLETCWLRKNIGSDRHEQQESYTQQQWDQL